MNQTRALIWKSYRELRWAVLVRLGGIMLLSIWIDWANARNGSFTSESPSGFVVAVGAAIGVLIAVTLTSNDLKGSLLNFWESRGISPSRYVLVKYVSGLVALMLICIPPLLFEMAFGVSHGQNLASFPMRVLSYSLYTFLLVYSASFAIGCLNRNAVPTALLSLAAGLLIYFGPLVVPGLGLLSTFKWFQEDTFRIFPISQGYLSTVDHFLIKLNSTGLYIHRGFPAFCISTLLLSGALLVLSMKAVIKGWVWQAHQKTTCWALAGVVLILFFGASTQIGSDMKIEKSERVDKSVESITKFVSAGNILLARTIPKDPNIDLELVFVDTSRDKMQRGTLVQRSKTDRTGYGNMAYASVHQPPIVVAEGPNPRAYTFLDELEEDGNNVGVNRINYRQTKLELIAVDASPLDGQAELESRILDRIDLRQYVEELGEMSRHYYLGYSYPGFPKIFIVRDKLIVSMSDASKRVLLFFDISSPDKPTYIRSIKKPDHYFSLNRYSSGDYECMFRQLPGLTPKESMEVCIMFGTVDHTAAEGDLVVVKDHQHNSIETYRLLGIDDVSDRLAPEDRDPEMNHLNARFERLDQYRIPIILRLLGESSSEIILKDGLLYDLTANISKSIIIYDVKDPRNIRRVGHFPSPDNYGRIGVFPLDDGRIVVGGANLTVLKPPKTSK